jgi:hypothetical protein
MNARLSTFAAATAASRVRSPVFMGSRVKPANDDQKTIESET